MKIEDAGLPGCKLIEIERLEDNRGFFARTYCSKEFAIHNIDFKIEQTSLSYNVTAGTMRGLHFQNHPFQNKHFQRP